MERLGSSPPPESAPGTKLPRDESIPTVTASSCAPPSPDLSSEDHCCWVCLDNGLEKELVQPCSCPRFCHASCIARWQLQSAGSRRETHCDFCNQRLPDWKQTLTPDCGATAPAVMNVNFDSKTYSFEVRSGPSGYKLFTEAIRKAFSLPGDSELNITFTCDEPSTGMLLTLQGAGAYDAAVHCAAVSAARRLSSPPSSPSSVGRACHDSESGCGSGSGMVPVSLGGSEHRASRSPTPGGLRLGRSASAPPATSSSAATLGASSNSLGPRSSHVRGGRRLTGIGRKLRAAIGEFLAIK